VLTDLAMPGVDGSAATAPILRDHPGTAVLVLTMHHDDEALFAALRAGASGYLLKDADGDVIIRAVLAVAAGEAVFGSGVARRVVDFFTDAHQDYTAGVFPELTPREGTCSTTWPPAVATTTSPGASCCPRRRSGTTSRPSSPSSGCPTARRLSAGTGRRPGGRPLTSGAVVDARRPAGAC
jgi:hypothetical protein